MNDFYCDEVLSGKTAVEKLFETDRILAFYHTKPCYKVHIVVIPKEHIPSLVDLNESHDLLLIEIFSAIKKIAHKVLNETGACRAITNMGNYQDSKHLHWHIISGEKIK